MSSLNAAYVRPDGAEWMPDSGTAATIFTLMPVPSDSQSPMPPTACPDHRSSHSTWSLTSKLAATDERRQLPLANICHQVGVPLLPADVMRRTISMPLSWLIPLGGSNEPTSSSEPVLRSHAKLRFAVPSHEPQRSATPEACAVEASASASIGNSQARRFRRGLRERPAR